MKCYPRCDVTYTCMVLIVWIEYKICAACLTFNIGGVAFIGGHFGEGTGAIWLDRVQCTGTERRLTDCVNSGENNFCTHQPRCRSEMCTRYFLWFLILSFPDFASHFWPGPQNYVQS